MQMLHNLGKLNNEGNRFFRQHVKSIRQRLMSVRQRLYVSLLTSKILFFL